MTLKIETELDILSATCTPPEGMQLSAGIWVTHDVDTGFVANRVAPALLDVDCDNECTTRQVCRNVFHEKKINFVILHAGDRRTINATIDQIQYIPVAGARRLHAKLAILLFTTGDRKKNTVRAVVTSANLTKGGFCSNRELLIVEDRVVREGLSASLARSLFMAVEALATDTKIDSEIFKSLIDTLGKVVPKAPLPTVHHTLGSDLNRKLFDSIKPKNAKFARIVIVTPPFAANTDTSAAELLLPYLGRKGAVEIYTQSESSLGDALSEGNTFRFSNGLLKKLKEFGNARVTVYNVPRRLDQTDSGPVVSRFLHAKLFGFVSSGTARVFIGSANFTGPGLGGSNRELLVEVEMTERKLNDLLASLNAIEWKGEILPPDRKSFSQDGNVVPVLSAVFKPDICEAGTNQKWRGTLTLQWEESDPPTSVRYADSSIEIIKNHNPFVLYERDRCLKAFFGQVEYSFIIEIDPHSGFWDAPIIDDKPETDANLIMFLRFVNSTFNTQGPTAKPNEVDKSVTDKRKSERKPIAFSIPLEQRLVLVARHREKIKKRWQGNRLSEILDRILIDKDGKPNNQEIEIAKHLLGVPYESSELLKCLAIAARSQSNE